MHPMTSTLPSPRAPLRTPGASPALGLLTNLLARLHAEAIRYCHWKSSEHLDASLLGTTDLDVLVHREDAPRLAVVLAESDFKPFRKLSGHDYPGIEDYLGCDGDTATLSHFHVHYQLTLGEKFLKGYQLPWVDAALASRVWDAEHGLYVIDPHLETVLLVVRAALKLRARDFLLAAAGYRYMRGGLLRELRWLARHVREDRLRAVARPLLGERASVLLSTIVTTPAPSMRQLIEFRRSAPLDRYRLFGPLSARGRRWGRELGWVWAALVNRVRGLTKRSTRVSTQGGLSVCVTGQQSTATRVAQQIIAWLAPELAVLPHLGPRAFTQARQARGRGVIVIADRLPTDATGDGPDVVIRVSDASTDLLQAQRTIWERM